MYNAYLLKEEAALVLMSVALLVLTTVFRRI